MSPLQCEARPRYPVLLLRDVVPHPSQMGFHPAVGLRNGALSQRDVEYTPAGDLRIRKSCREVSSGNRSGGDPTV